MAMAPDGRLRARPRQETGPRKNSDLDATAGVNGSAGPGQPLASVSPLAQAARSAWEEVAALAAEARLTLILADGPAGHLANHHGGKYNAWDVAR
jgi:hypothetical protein